MLLTFDPATKLALEYRFESRPRTCWPGPRGQTSRSNNSAGPPARFPPTSRRIGRLRFEAPKGFAKVDSLLGAPDDAHAKNSKCRQARPRFYPDLARWARKDQNDHQGRAGRQSRRDRLLGNLVRALPDGAASRSRSSSILIGTSKKDVIVVALSQDDDPSDLAQVRKLVEKTLADKKINLTGNPVGRIGLDPSKSVGDGVRGRRIPDARHRRRQGNRSVCSRRLQSRSGGAAQQDSRQGNRYVASGEVARESRRQGQVSLVSGR